MPGAPIGIQSLAAPKSIQSILAYKSKPCYGGPKAPHADADRRPPTSLGRNERRAWMLRVKPSSSHEPRPSRCKPAPYTRTTGGLRTPISARYWPTHPLASDSNTSSIRIFECSHIPASRVSRLGIFSNFEFRTFSSAGGAALHASAVHPIRRCGTGRHTLLTWDGIHASRDLCG